MDVTKSFGRLRALDDVTLDIEGKKITLLIGPNGSGKTTLVNTISGFYKPEKGTIVYVSQDITGWAPHRIFKSGIARTFQVPSLFWKLTVLENMVTAAKDNQGELFSKALLRGSWESREAEAVETAFEFLELLGLVDHWEEPVYGLSGGQMKLLEIGRALMSSGRLLLLDEPIAGVNPTLAHEIFDRLVKLRDELDTTFFIIEHRLDIALEYVDYVSAMANGKVIAHGTPEEVVNNPKVLEAYLGG